MQVRDFLPKGFHTLEPQAKQAARLEAYEALRAWQARRKIELAAEKAERDQHAMTCQICGRRILANKGTIAHHGYERPGEGWQTASCAGAKELPFEVERDVLLVEITHARAYAAMRAEQAKAIRAETAPVAIKYSVLVEDKNHKRSGWEDRLLRDVTRANFEAKQIECPEAFEKQKGEYNRETYKYAPFTFDVALERHVHPIEYDVQKTTQYADDQQARYDAWKQTHERRDGAWVPLKEGAR
jgi:hypothetical protein